MFGCRSTMSVFAYMTTHTVVENVIVLCAIGYVRDYGVVRVYVILSFEYTYTNPI